MSVIGPVVLLLGTPEVDYGDFLSKIEQAGPAPIVFEGINRDYSESPTRGYNITLTSIQEDLTDGTLWRWMWDHFDEKDSPVTWAPERDAETYFQGVITSIPDPKTGGSANQHGSFDVTLTLKERPLLIPPPVEVLSAIAARKRDAARAAAAAAATPVDELEAPDEV